MIQEGIEVDLQTAGTSCNNFTSSCSYRKTLLLLVHKSKQIKSDYPFISQAPPRSTHPNIAK